MMATTTFNFRAIRGSLRRNIRAAIFRAVDNGLLESLARAITAFNRRRGLYLQGRILGVARRHADHAEFWQVATIEYPSDAMFLRQSIHFALRAGKRAQAEEALASLVAARQTRAADCDFVIGLAYICEQCGDRASILSLVRRFLKSLRGTRDYRIAALRLNRVILAFFPRTRNATVGASHERSRRQLVKMIERASLQTAPRLLLEHVVQTESVLAGGDSFALLETDVSHAQCKAFVRLVCSRVATAEPFSLVRIGDGEAACLPYEPYLAWLAKGDAVEREKIWWGNALTPSQQRRMHRLVFNAIWSADSIGIPTVARFIREMRLTENDNLDRTLTGRGLRSILYSLGHYKSFRGSTAPAPVFTSCHLHQDLARWDLYPELMGTEHELVLVSCHPELADFVQTKFGSKVAASLVLPPDRVSGPALKSAAMDSRSLPDVLDDFVAELRTLARGRLVLVGGGYLGKWLVDIARAEGGVALDLGSVFDYWLGLSTRSYLDLNPLR